jgi:hypothetical protein
LLFTLHKTVQAAGPLAHGCLELSTANGETLNAIYDIDLGAENDHGFGAGSNGKLTFVGGTGRFQDASGTAALGGTFTIIYPASSFIGGTSAPIRDSPLTRWMEPCSFQPEIIDRVDFQANPSKKAKPGVARATPGHPNRVE